MKNDDELVLNTSRLLLRMPNVADSIKLQAFDERNTCFSPSEKIDYKTLTHKWEEELNEGKSIRFLLFLKENPDGEIIGVCNFTQIIRNPFHACYLGYHIDKAYEGRGLMSEALEAAINYVFNVQNLHRIMANYIPSNARSAKLLQKLGFITEGHAKNYLLIKGKWEDHVLSSLTNDNWKPKT